MLHLTLDRKRRNRSMCRFITQIKQQIRAGVNCTENLSAAALKRQLAGADAASASIQSAPPTASWSRKAFYQAQPQRGFFVCHLDEVSFYKAISQRNNSLPPAAARALFSMDFSINDVARDKFPFQAWRKTDEQAL